MTCYYQSQSLTSVVSIVCETLHHLQFHNWCYNPGMPTIYKQYTTLCVSQQLTYLNIST